MFITPRATAEAMATIMESLFMNIDLCVFLCLARSKIVMGSGMVARTVSACGNWSRGCHAAPLCRKARKTGLDSSGLLIVIRCAPKNAMNEPFV
jgi:hypothetical protein